MLYESVATPDASKIEVPSRVLPLLKDTVPLGLELPVTLEVKLTVVPLTTLMADDCRVVVVLGSALACNWITSGDNVPSVAREIAAVLAPLF